MAVPEVATGSPWASVTTRAPASSTEAVSPSRDRGTSSTSWPWGTSLTTNTSSYPATRAWSCRSTPSSMFGYVAVSPETTGAGRDPDQSSENWLDPSARVAAAPAPPSENVVSAADSAGWKPSSVR